MQTQILNLPDALQLASIVNKYVDTESIPDTPMEFILSVISQMSETDIVILSKLLKMEISSNPEDFILMSMENLVENKILDLLICYKQIGFS